MSLSLTDVQAQVAILDQDAQVLVNDSKATQASQVALKAAQDDLTAKQTQQSGDASKLDAQLANVKALLDQYSSQAVLQQASSPPTAPAPQGS